MCVYIYAPMYVCKYEYVYVYLCMLYRKREGILPMLISN